MAKLFDWTSLIGGILLAISLISLGIFAVRHGQRKRGVLLLLTGICAVILLIYTLTTPEP